MAIIERIPKLNARVKHLIKVYSFELNKAFNEANIDITALHKDIEKKEPIGAIQKLSIKTEKELHHWRELNYDTLGRIMEVYPSLPKYSISVDKIALFKNHLLDAFSAVKKDVFAGDTNDNPLKASFNIYNQIAPIHIGVDILTPTTNEYSGSKNIFVLLYDCWFDKSEIEFNISDKTNLVIVQQAELTCAGLIPYKPA